MTIVLSLVAKENVALGLVPRPWGTRPAGVVAHACPRRLLERLRIGALTNYTLTNDRVPNP